MLYALLADSASRFPQRTALEWCGGGFSYAELTAAVQVFRARLQDSGLQRGDRIVILLPNSPEFVVATFAVAALGGVAVTLNTAFKADELAIYLEDSTPRGLVATPGLMETHGDLIASTAPECIVHTENIIGGADDVGAASDEAHGDDFALYQYSSGSTGVPKRVARTHRNLAAEVESFGTTVEVTKHDRVLGVVPFYHAHGFSNCMMAAISAGATLVVMPAFNRKAVFEMLSEGGITIFPAVPFMLSMLADSPSIPATSLSSLRVVFTAGAPLPGDTFDAFLAKFDVAVRQLYGSTEMGAITINLGDTEGRRAASVGHALANIEVLIIGDDGDEVAAGETGELVVNSGAGARAYGNQPELGQDTFRNGLFWSGDLGYKDAEGYIFVSGRKTLFINAAGNKVDPTQVEEVILDHPNVDECVVVGVSGNYGQEVVKAIVVGGNELSVDQIKEWCVDKLADYKVPRMIEFRDEIPRSPIGKILRKYLQ